MKKYQLLNGPREKKKLGRRQAFLGLEIIKTLSDRHVFSRSKVHENVWWVPGVFWIKKC
jgi:hypothetical protein